MQGGKTSCGGVGAGHETPILRLQRGSRTRTGSSSLTNGHMTSGARAQACSPFAHCCGRPPAPSLV
eukprot:2726631-Prymnesium_polylepis.2